MVTRSTAAESVASPSPATRSADSGRRRRPGAIVAALIGVPLVIVLAAVCVVAALALTGTSVDASRWRDPVARRASAALGRPLLLQGALELEPALGRELGLHVGALRLLNPPGFDGPELLAIGELRVRIDLIDALRGRLHASRIEARDVDLRLERRADGAANWTSSPASDSGSPEIDLAAIALRGVSVVYHDARSATRRSLQLDEVSGSVGRERPLRLAARGRWETGLAYSVSVEGGTLRLLDEGAEAWPFALEAGTQGARLQATGAIDARRHMARLQVDASADDLGALPPVAGSPLAAFGRGAVRCAVRLGADAVDVSDLRGTLGESEFSGQLALALDGARPRLRGALSVATLDLQPLLATPPRSAGEGGASLRDLTALDAEVDLKVARWLGLGVEVRDAAFAWSADARGLRVPASATVAGVPLAGTLEVDTSAATPTLSVRLDADKAVLDELARSVDQARVGGSVGRARLRLDSRGETAAALADDVAFSLTVAAAQLRLAGTAGAEPIALSIDSLDLSAPRGGRMRGQARGALQGEAVSLTFRGGPVRALRRERALPLELDVALDRARVHAEGRLAFTQTTPDADLRFDFHAARVGDFARWLNVSPQASLPVAVRGRVRVSPAAWSLDDTNIELGSSRLAVEARRRHHAGRPVIAATVRGTLVDAQELSTLPASSANRGAEPRARAGAGQGAIDLPDADVDVRLQRLRLARTELGDLALRARVREGRLLPSSLTGRVAGAAFAAQLEADPRAEPPTADLSLSTGEIDLGTLLRGLGVAEDIDGRVQALQADVRARGRNPGEWAGQSAIDLRLRGGTLAVRGAARSTLAEIRVDEARLGAQAGEPLRGRLDGALDETPVTIDVASGSLAELAADASRVPFTLTARAAGTQLALAGDVSLPLGSGGQLDLEMRGERLDSLSALARVELPAWGPWSFSSPIQMTDTGYELPRLRARVGSSELDGRAALDLSGPRPDLELQVAARTIQLDDFPLPERLTESADERRTVRQTASGMARRTDKLLSAAFLRRFDARIDVKAKEVLSGSDRLADGSLRLKLERGHLDLDPVVVNLPGGALRLSVAYDLKESEVELAVAAYVERFDYGIIARRLDRGQNVRGLFSLSLELASTAPSLETIMHKASGRVDFAVWPTELRSGVFNLWSVNLMLQLLPLIDPDPRPTVNCIVGRFDLASGDLRDDKLVIDTSAVRIRGAGHANLATEELEFVFRPRAKGVALFRLQTPLRVTGTLGDQRFGFAPTEVVGSIVRLVASPILLPIERITLGPLPRDGADVCTDPLRAIAR